MMIGLFQKYLLAKADGSEIDPSAKYFVLRYDQNSKDQHAAIAALQVYAQEISEDNPELTDDLMQELEKVRIDRT